MDVRITSILLLLLLLLLLSPAPMQGERVGSASYPTKQFSPVFHIAILADIGELSGIYKYTAVESGVGGFDLTHCRVLCVPA